MFIPVFTTIANLYSPHFIRIYLEIFLTTNKSRARGLNKLGSWIT